MSAARSALVDVRSGPELAPKVALERWEAAMSETYIPLAVAPHRVEGFGGRIAATEFDGLLVTSVQAAAQTVRRTPRLVAAAADRYILASIYLSGRGVMHQDGREAHIGAGDMVFYDSARPYRWEIDEPFDKVVVQVPMARLAAAAGPAARTVPTAIAVGPEHPAAAVGAYFRGLARLQRTDPVRAAELATHGPGLMASALHLLAGPGEPPTAELTRARVLAFMRKRCADAELTVEAVARRFAVSPRTLYRLFEGAESPARRLLRMRLDHACALLRDCPSRSVREVAAAAGFSAERHFYRVFHAELGMTPGDYRAAISLCPAG
ncbi:helix-turn-helix domain-containing protein [Nocardia sp. SSK8]|uniref:AraC-like ligand-binding domain-containing protein n=1 Tax=Nocardia sp. SSK8 TaxID=3120154 RepID=UPI0030089888